MTVLTVIPALAMWLAAVARLPSAVRQPSSRPFTVAVAVFAAAATLRIPDIAGMLARISGDSTVSETAKNALTVLGAASLRGIVAATKLEKRNVHTHRHRLAGAAILALVLLAAFTPAGAHGIDYTGRASPLETAWAVTYWTIFLTAVATSMLGIVSGASAAARTSRRRVNTVAFGFLAAGCAVGLLWVLVMFILLALNRLGLDARLAAAFYKPLVLVAMALVALSAIAPVPALLAARWRRQWSPAARARTAALHRLWFALIEAAPAITLNPESGGRRSPRPTSSYRLLIEVRDGILAVRPYVTQRLRDAAERASAQAGHTGGQRQLVSAAIQLEIGRVRKLRGDSPGADNPLDSGEGGNIATETEVLGVFARVWEDPATQRLATEITDRTGVQ